MTPFEGIRRSNRDVSPYQIPTPNFATIPNGRTTHAVVEAAGALPHICSDDLMAGMLNRILGCPAPFPFNQFGDVSA
jgi:hypothetical protein